MIQTWVSERLWQYQVTTNLWNSSLWIDCWLPGAATSSSLGLGKQGAASWIVKVQQAASSFGYVWLHWLSVDTGFREFDWSFGSRNRQAIINCSIYVRQAYLHRHNLFTSNFSASSSATFIHVLRLRPEFDYRHHRVWGVQKVRGVLLCAIDFRIGIVRTVPSLTLVDVADGCGAAEPSSCFSFRCLFYFWQWFHIWTVNHSTPTIIFGRKLQEVLSLVSAHSRVCGIMNHDQRLRLLPLIHASIPLLVPERADNLRTIFCCRRCNCALNWLETWTWRAALVPHVHLFSIYG